MPEPTATQLPLELVKIAIGVATPIVVAVLSGCRLDDRDGNAPATTPSARTGKARKPREKPSSVPYAARHSGLPRFTRKTEIHSHCG